MRRLVFTLMLVSCTSDAKSDGLPNTTKTDPREGVQSGGTIVVDEVGRELGLLRETHYQHTVAVNEVKGTFDLDCSGFIDYVVGSAMPAHFRELAAATRTRPLAEDFVTYFGAHEDTEWWSAVKNAHDLVAGDVVAWLAPPDTGNSGHVVIVREAPRVRDASSVLVPIWDSTHNPHVSTDPRTAEKATGIGTAEIVLLLDGTGAPIGHEWFDGDTKVIERTSMGRPR
jgi:hypothetical protein